MARILTLQQLLDASACSEQVEKFHQMFGDSVEVTEATSIAVAHEFDFDFAARHFLSSTVWAEYTRVRDIALAEYTRVTTPAWAEYTRVRDTAWAEYERVIASAWDTVWAEYEHATAPACAEYKRVRAVAFATFYNLED